MKKKYLALFLAAAMTVTSLESAVLVSAEDFSTESSEEITLDEEEESTDVSTEDTDDEEIQPEVETEEAAVSEAVDFTSEEEPDDAKGDVEVTSISFNVEGSRKVLYTGVIDSLGDITVTIKYSNNSTDSYNLNDWAVYTDNNGNKFTSEVVDAKGVSQPLSDVIDSETGKYNLKAGKYKLVIAEYSEMAKYDFEVKNLEDDTSRQIREGSNTVTFGGRSEAYYWFKPAADGIYVIDGSASESLEDVKIWKKDATGEYETVSEWTYFTLEKDTTYMVQLVADEFSKETTSFECKVSKADITGLSFIPAGMERTPEGIFVKGTMTCTYGDGKSYNVEINSQYDWGGATAPAIDPVYEIPVDAEYTAQDGTTKWNPISFDAGSKVTVTFKVGNISTEPCTMTIPGALDLSKYPELTEGTNTITGADSNHYEWFRFTPKDTASYSFIADIDTFHLWQRAVDEQGRPQPWSYWSTAGDKIDHAFIAGGKTYLIGLKAVGTNTTGTFEIARRTLEGCSWKTIKNTQATCTAVGEKVESCSVHKGETRTTVYPAGNHKLSWKVTKEPTVSETGKKIQQCSVCGKTVAEETISKLAPKVMLSVKVRKTIPLKVKQSYAVKVSDLAKGDKVVSWTSSNKKVVTVSASGKLKGKKAGTAKITVKLASGYSVWFKVKVQKANVKTTSLKVINKATGKKAAKKITLKRKAKLSLSAVTAPVTSKEKVTFASSNKKVATVTSKGVVTAKKKGTAVITVKSGKKSVKIKVRVK